MRPPQYAQDQLHACSSDTIEQMSAQAGATHCMLRISHVQCLLGPPLAASQLHGAYLRRQAAVPLVLLVLVLVLQVWVRQYQPAV